MASILQRTLNWLDWLTREIPPPKSQQPTIKLIPSQLTPAEQDILNQAEQALKQLEIQSQPILQEIKANPVIYPEPEPVQFLEVPEVLEVSPVSVAAEVLEVSEIPSLAIVEEPLAVPKISEILATVEPLQIEGQTPAGWTEIEAGNEQAPEIERKSSVGLSRKLLVEQHLEQAWADGFRTYDQLMNYVELATGKGCSKRVISTWKKARKLDEAVPVDEAAAA